MFKTIKLKYLIDESNNYPIGDGDHGSISPDLYKEEGIPYIRVQNLSFHGQLKYPGMTYISEETHKNNLKSKIVPDDILIAKTGGTVGKLCLVPNKFNEYNTTSSVGKVTLDKNKLLPKFLIYFFQSGLMQDLIKKISYQKSAQPGFNIDDLKEFKIACPEIINQQLIVEYLDKKIQKIDSLKNKTERKIELLNEQKNALINKYVTKGLNPNIELKDSGIEWIGHIPKHWEIHPVSKIFDENKVKNALSRNDVLTLSYGKIKYRDLSKLDGLLPKSFDNYQVMNVESIIIRSTDLQNDHKSLRVGHVGIPGVITSAYLGLNPKLDIKTKFFYYSIHLADLKKILYGLGGGIRQSLRFEDFKKFPIISPPEKERINISNHLDNIENQINDLISKLSKKIDFLNEYRQSVISSIVTGKTEITEEML